MCVYTADSAESVVGRRDAGLESYRAAKRVASTAGGSSTAQDVGLPRQEEEGQERMAIPRRDVGAIETSVCCRCGIDAEHQGVRGIVPLPAASETSRSPNGMTTAADACGHIPAHGGPIRVACLWRGRRDAPRLPSVHALVRSANPADVRLRARPAGSCFAPRTVKLPVPCPRTRNVVPGCAGRLLRRSIRHRACSASRDRCD